MDVALGGHGVRVEIYSRTGRGVLAVGLAFGDVDHAPDRRAPDGLLVAIQVEGRWAHCKQKLCSPRD